MLSKKVALILSSLYLQACVPFGLYENAYTTGANYFNPKPFVLTQEIINSPYAMQLVRHQNSHAVLVLSFVDQDARLSWVDSNGDGFTTIDGKIIASRGLKNDLEIIDPPRLKEVYLSLINGHNQPHEHISAYRLSSPPTAYLEMKHSFKILETKDKTILRRINNAEVKYKLIQELVSVPAIRWEAENYYWIDHSGAVLKSKQELAPNMEKYFLEILKDFRS